MTGEAVGGATGGSGRPLPLRMCVRCERITDEPVLVAEVHGNSGPGWNVYACPGCAPHVPAAPDPLVVLEALLQSRRGGPRR
ncbi:hypothetical protein [Streptomyces sp. N2A]|uniref:hypothetical protein n=1 Tax=Streptomyces sp. N2A TaxID=3073936 RepID=UPI0028701518|nr:hypothetical protein [Streptomyces sp. N2A]